MLGEAQQRRSCKLQGRRGAGPSTIIISSSDDAYFEKIVPSLLMMKWTIPSGRSLALGRGLSSVELKLELNLCSVGRSMHQNVQIEMY
jgi:hypothetical protein